VARPGAQGCTSSGFSLYCCVRWECISTPPSRKALYLTAFAPLLEDTLHLCVGLVESVFRRQLAGGSLSKHGRDHPGIENLVDGSIGIAGVPDIGDPVEGICQHLVLLGWIGLVVPGKEGLQVGHSLGEAGEVVELASQESLPEVADVVHQELFCTVDVFRKL